MSARFADSSIRRKLTIAMALATMLALLLSGAALGAYEVATFRGSLVQKLTTIADIVGRNCTAALAFGEGSTARDVLAALEAEHDVDVGAVYDSHGRLFASYTAPHHEGLLPPATAGPDGVQFSSDALTVVRPIVHERERLGTVYIRSDLDELLRRMRVFGAVMLGILTCCGLIGLVASARLQRWITAPILDLARTARTVTSDRNFAVRATAAGRDEVGALVDDFNRMLAEIQDQDRQLRANKDALEAQVASRTAELVSANEQLVASVRQAEQHADQIAQLTTLGQLLQSCHTADEIFGVVQHSVRTLFPSDSGGLFLLRSSGNLMELMAAWGDAPPHQRVFTPDDCWGFRRGRPHLVDESTSPLRCTHLTDEDRKVTLCLPMVALGDTVGILQFSFWHDETPRQVLGLESTQGRLAVALAEHIGLAVANLRLREALRNQSIIDSLTGLFNRRYLEQTLERECRRALRAGRPLAVVMLDVDHFKQLNDAWGHDGGDAVLKDLGTVLRANVRGEDVACRHGGEEFVLVFADATLESARARAEQLRELVAELPVRHLGHSIGPITASIGVAGLPEHGSTPEALLAAADKALYEAKHSGRNRVKCAPVDPESSLHNIPVS
jgi:diguanylate cyclase (GGDEF)-like protein